MKIDKLSFPHPVLGRGDDVDGEYDVNASVRMGSSEIELVINHGVSNDSIKQIINNGKAVYCVEVNCAKTLFRKSFLSSETTQIVSIPSESLRGRTRAVFYIVIKSDITGYFPDGLNEAYGGTKFELDAGEVLGYGGHIDFIAAKEWASTRSVSSIMTIGKLGKKEGPFEIDINADRIVVLLSDKDYERFLKTVRFGYDSIFHSSIVLPVLIYALSELVVSDGDTEEYSDYQWYQILENLLNSEDMKHLRSRDRVHEAAQKILENPLSRTLDKLENLIEE